MTALLSTDEPTTGANALAAASTHEILRVGMVAGEASGDLLASLLLQGVNQHWPQWQASGIGGPQMAAQGFVAHWPSERLAVHGFNWELVRRFYGLWRMRQQLRDRFLAEKPDLFIGVDAPDFNFGLEAALRQGGIRTMHFVCPSIWAWRPNRIETIRRSAEHVLCIFPFEPALLHQHGIAATYVGHPLANVLPMQPDQAAARHTLGLPLGAQVLAILPGSRQGEITWLAERFLQAAKLLRQQRPELLAVLPAVPTQYARLVQMVQAAGVASWVKVTQGQSHAALTACDVTLIASGTATLEAALLKRPMVISYAMHPLSARLLRRNQQLQPWVGLPNILCGDFVVPELLQEAATPAALAAALAAWFDDPARIAHLHTRFTALHHELQRDTATLASHAIRQVLAR